MSEGLFRREALDARRSSWLGGIQLAQPVRLWMLTLGAAIAASAVILFLVLGTYTRRSTVTGHLVPTRGLSTVVAPARGVVGSVEVQEGDRVRAGQPLAVVTVPRATPGNGDTLAALEERLQRRQEGLDAGRSAQLQQLRVQEAGLRSQLATARRELAQVEAEIATRREQVRIARETLDRLRQLEDVRYVSLLQIKQQESAALAQLGEMQVLERQATATRRMIAQLEQALAELPAQRGSTNAGYARELAALEQEQVETRARGELVLTAAVDGIVTTQLAKPGQAVQAGQPLLTVLPGDGVLEAELLVPSRAIGFIEPGDRVMLRYQAYPYQKFGHQQGRVERISRSALGPGELGDAQAAEPSYRVTVALARQAVVAYGREEPLRPGMLLDADILGEQRRLVEWLLEPLYSLKGVG
ncbi:HlyD family efflux transporter periplasmic adaptor subunit [Pseudoxanthomonas sp. J35]|uniref:HlyD family secretion protein n=1 Tax=Pseudoxanthomonas sp. J35 TaxID=935852 RepID=UPI0004AFDED6|nr:HlyD family efflux transporter periplasmic adaptor subunit [Pseudoxanthomonas sp. J35]